ncbi:MAG TPA: 30S ribosomal protein S4 [Chloroflexia bacterium]|nr:30S ribosomal protein S4 [Chloroflexia bacterium]
MARYTGPVCKLCRREGVKLMLKGDRCMGPKCSVERRPTAPGVHGAKRQRKMSDFGLQLREKQKARRIYGILEKQFSKHYSEAKRIPGATGERLLQILELRLDNIVYRLGLADSRPQARQIVRHGHITVNGRTTDIPSYIVKAGDTIAVKENSKGKEYFKIAAETVGKTDVPGWLNLDARNLSGRVVNIPARADLDVVLDEQLIVEYYSR